MSEAEAIKKNEYAPKQLARMVKHWLPQPGEPKYALAASCRQAHDAVDELERLATDRTAQEAIETRVARLEEKVTKPQGEYSSTFQQALAKLADKWDVHVKISSIDTAETNGGWRGFSWLKPEELAPAPLPPAESCAHAVERFREALLLLTKRHEVEVEIGHIEPGSCGGGIKDLPDPAEVDAEYRAQFDEAIRERKAWDALDKWVNSPILSRSRSIEIVARGAIKLEERRFYSDSTKIESKTFRGTTRLEVLESAAAWAVLQ